MKIGTQIKNVKKAPHGKARQLIKFTSPNGPTRLVFGGAEPYDPAKFGASHKF